MSESVNLARKIKEQLPADLVGFISAAGEAAQNEKINLYLVGGVVRDLLLGLPNLDLDLVAEGDAMALAQRLAETYHAKITTHPHFQTARIDWDARSIDITTARSETYERPGALPAVRPGSIKDDLFRRDFTVNTMAVYLTPDRYGEVIDLYGGIDDLAHKIIRILHDKSFTDDATRMWRAVRYEQRLDFLIEPVTLNLLKNDLNMLDTITGDRIRYELECVFKEKTPERALRRAGELGVLAKLHPSLKGNGWLAKKFEETRRMSLPAWPSFGLYLALLAYPLTGDEISRLGSYLNLPKADSRVLKDTSSLKARLESLAKPGLKSSQVYHILHGFSPEAILANLIASDTTAVRENIRLYFDKLRYVKLSLSGDDLLKMGVKQGPEIKVILDKLLDLKLDGEVKGREEELARVEKDIK